MTTRQEVWIRALCASARLATLCQPVEWADKALENFDKRFPEAKTFDEIVLSQQIVIPEKSHE